MGSLVDTVVIALTKNELELINHSTSLSGLKINLDSLGVLQVPNGLCGVQNDYKQWNESCWQEQQTLTDSAKEHISQELLHVFETLDHQSYMLGKYKESNKPGEETQPSGSFNQSKLEESGNFVALNKPSIGMLNKQDETNRTVEEEESDEDLSYLL